jgi:hypothetical protein
MNPALAIPAVVMIGNIARVVHVRLLFPERTALYSRSHSPTIINVPMEAIIEVAEGMFFVRGMSTKYTKAPKEKARQPSPSKLMGCLAVASEGPDAGCRRDWRATTAPTTKAAIPTTVSSKPILVNSPSEVSALCPK